MKIKLGEIEFEEWKNQGTVNGLSVMLRKATNNGPRIGSVGISKLENEEWKVWSLLWEAPHYTGTPDPFGIEKTGENLEFSDPEKGKEFVDQLIIRLDKLQSFQ